MTTVSMESFTGLGEKLKCNVGKMTECFIWTSSRGLRLVEK